MKSFMLFVMVAVAATVGLKGQSLFSFGLNLNWSRTETSDLPDYSAMTAGGGIYPKIGYLFNDVIAVGIGGGGSLQSTSTESDNSDIIIFKRENWFVSPFIRFYFSDSNKLRFLIDCSMRYGENKTATTVDGDKIEADKTYKVTGYYLEPALSYKVSDYLSVEMSIGNLRYTSTTDNTTGAKSSGFYASMGLETITGRLMYIFGNKKDKKNETLDKFK